MNKIREKNNQTKATVIIENIDYTRQYYYCYNVVKLSRVYSFDGVS